MAEEFHLVTKCAGCSTQLQRSCTVCTRCRTRYCGPVCAKRHYENGHSLVCKKIAQRGGVERRRTANITCRLLRRRRSTGVYNLNERARRRGPSRRTLRP